MHGHTNEPGKALQYGMVLGNLDKLKIDNMLLERMAKEEEERQNAPPKDYGIVSVSLGEGFSQIFRDLGVDAIVDGGQTMNPSIEDLARAVEGIHARTIFVLPNNGNIILAARQVAELSDKDVIVLPTKNVAMGIAAVVAFQPDFPKEENEQRMNEASERVRTGAITYAVRDTDIGDMHIKQGSIIGLNNGQVTVNNGSIVDTALLMQDIVTDDDRLITVYYGADAKPRTRRRWAPIAERHPMVDVEVHAGGAILLPARSSSQPGRSGRPVARHSDYRPLCEQEKACDWRISRPGPKRQALREAGIECAADLLWQLPRATAIPARRLPLAALTPGREAASWSPCRRPRTRYVRGLSTARGRGGRQQPDPPDMVQPALAAELYQAGDRCCSTGGRALQGRADHAQPQKVTEQGISAPQPHRRRARRTIAGCVAQLLPQARRLPGTLPGPSARHGLCGLAFALRQAHQPADGYSAGQAPPGFENHCSTSWRSGAQGGAQPASG